MSTEEKKAAIVYASPELNRAAEIAAQSFHQFVNYVESLDPKLEHHEAILMAAAILDGIPDLFATDARLIGGIKAHCQLLRRKR